jgi:hypothetical protein
MIWIFFTYRLVVTCYLVDGKLMFRSKYNANGYLIKNKVHYKEATYFFVGCSLQMMLFCYLMTNGMNANIYLIIDKYDKFWQ